MFQVGWRRHSAAVAPGILAASQVRRGPPEAVIINRSTFSLSCPSKHWNIAECSLSMGSISTLYSVANAVINGPPATKVSLLARPIVFLHLIASTVGSIPAAPTMAVMTMVASGRVAPAIKASLPPMI